jgi:hypothetical protein
MKKVIALLFAFYMMLILPAYAADTESRFMHNDHDTLIIGKITELSQDTMTIRAIDYIVSAKDLNVNAKKKQLRPEVVKLTSDSVKMLRENAKSGWSSRFEVGDSVVASLNKKGSEFDIAWGFFKADSTDYKTLSVEAYSPMTAAMIKDFINSGGKYTEFSCDGYKKTVTRVETDGTNNRKETVIYQGTNDNINDFSTNVADGPKTNTKINNTKYIIYGIIGMIIIVFIMIYNIKRHRQ